MSCTTVPLMTQRQQLLLTGCLSKPLAALLQLAPSRCSPTHLFHLQPIYTLPGQTAAEWAPTQRPPRKAVITFNLRPGADIINHVCHYGERVMT